MEVYRNGYTTLIDLITISQSPDSLLMTLTGDAAVLGSIIDSQTGNGLPSVTVSFTRDGLPEFVLTTNDSGRFEITGAPTGNFTMTAEQTGFFTRSVEDLTLQEGSNEIPNAIAVSRPKEGELRIVLSWGEYPLDLDSHLTGPTVVDDTKRFHVYWDNKNPEEAVSLDVDDVFSYGPEATTINNIVPNRVYYYYVHNYEPRDASVSGTEIADSPAVVEVYDVTGLIASFTPSLPVTPTNNLWHVFRISTWPEGSPPPPSAYEAYTYCNSVFCIVFTDDYYFVRLNEE